jgi:hypothetical protein
MNKKGIILELWRGPAIYSAGNQIDAGKRNVLRLNKNRMLLVAVPSQETHHLLDLQKNYPNL